MAIVTTQADTGRADGCCLSPVPSQSSVFHAILIIMCLLVQAELAFLHRIWSDVSLITIKG